MSPLLLIACMNMKMDSDTGHSGMSMGTEADTDTDTDTDSDTDSDTDTDNTDPVCGVRPGDWAWTGECPGMTTPVTLIVADCEISLDYGGRGGMSMGMPYSGTIVDTNVTFADDNSVMGCVGTIESPDAINGGCDGCTFALAR